MRAAQMSAPANELRHASIARARQLSAAMDHASAIPECPLCGCASTKKAFHDNGCSLRVCHFCELFFADPYPRSDVQHGRVSSGWNSEIELLDCARRYQGERLYYERHFPLIAEESRGAASLLDVGCGTGHLLEKLRGSANLNLAGIELDPEAARFARRVSGCVIHEIPFERFRSQRKFDAITLINVFSHIPSFDGLFGSLRAALRPEGKVILRTSEMSLRVSRWNQMHWGIPDDIHFLGLRTLDFLCAKYGFAVKRHIRTPFEDELFLRSRWQQMGRSRFLNLVKSAGVRVPGVLPRLKQLYAAMLGERLFVSFIVLQPVAGETERK
jgi:SAM-dependent methyltransferase